MDFLVGDMPEPEILLGAPYVHAARPIADHQAEGAWLQSLPEAPVFRPTAAEWEDPLRYIASIRAEGEAAGLAVVVSPFAPSVLPAQGLSRSLGTFRARWQRLERVRTRKWEPPGFEEDARPYTLQRFVKEAEKETRRLFGGLSAAPPPRTVEREYWARHGRAGKARRGRVYALYANDIPGSAFCARDALGASRWNLNSLAQEPGCVLRACPDPVPGVTQPMLYLGSAFASFAWHVEDQRLASINYAHAGAAKVWYGVPAAHADAFEAAKTVLVSPEELTRRGVRVVRAEQHPGSFVLTFPRAYHAGFSAGVHLGEAINLSLDDWWWPHGDAARREYRALRRPEVAPYEMLLCHRALEVATDGAGGNAGERVLAMSQDDPPGALVPPKRVEWADVEVPGRVKRFAKALPEDELAEVDRKMGVEEAVPKPMAHDPDSESTELEFEIELPYLEPSPDAAVDTAATSLPESAQANGVLNGPYNASNGIATPTQSEPAATGQRKRSWFKVEPGQSRFGRAIRPSQWVSQADDSMYAE
ncbi:hypothetical protein QBZ16_002853 [Prototheca wickerhamii]|uniref:Uncharacterized protein n=1 Tax=Prototheca wickerhamii TaxID=3111 RepID=A0AAD9IMS5_PROWI|nr:hypothetical protein QBZ16_002853 [Prototheca wickerhamii]